MEPTNTSARKIDSVSLWEPTRFRRGGLQGYAQLLPDFLLIMGAVSLKTARCCAAEVPSAFPTPAPKQTHQVADININIRSPGKNQLLPASFGGQAMQTLTHRAAATN